MVAIIECPARNFVSPELHTIMSDEGDYSGQNPVPHHADVNPLERISDTRIFGDNSLVSLYRRPSWLGLLRSAMINLMLPFLNGFILGVK